MWFDGVTAGWLGGILGSSIGMLGAVLGITAGTCAPKGKCRWLVLGMMKLSIVAGILLLVAGGVAFFLGQPYHVWYPFTLCGGILCCVMIGVYPGIKKAYTVAELKKMKIDDM